jgi:hypothetical protein
LATDGWTDDKARPAVLFSRWVLLKRAARFAVKEDLAKVFLTARILPELFRERVRPAVLALTFPALALFILTLYSETRFTH